MKVAVIGAGPSGLAAVKELVQEGHEAICYDGASSIGGGFALNKVYSDMELTVSNYFIAFSDFVPTDQPLRIWRRKDYVHYLNKYIDKFSIRGNIKLKANIDKIEKLDIGNWKLSINTVGADYSEEFDAVVIASGMFRKPRIPAISGLNTFSGEVIHSSEFRDRQYYKGKRVLCVGFGESASDITYEISGVSRKCVLSIRRLPSVAPKYLSFQKDPYFTLDSSWITSRAVNRCPSLVHKLLAKSIELKEKRSSDPVFRVRAKWSSHAGSSVHQVVTKNDRLLTAVADGSVEVNTFGIKRVDGSEVEFFDGSKETFDALLFNTGYELDIPFYGKKIRDPRSLYKQIFIPELGERLSFIGFVRPQQGGVPPISEMQSRFVARVYSGKLRLPGVSEQHEVIKRSLEHWKSEYSLSPDVPGLINYCHYMDALSRDIGCYPKVSTNPKNIELAIKLYYGPMFSAQYRLNGPGMDAKEAKRFLTNFPLPMSRLRLIFVGGIYTISKFIKKTRDKGLQSLN